MEPQRLEVESEAWYRAIAEGRLAPVSDPRGQYPLPERPLGTQWLDPYRRIDR